MRTKASGNPETTSGRWWHRTARRRRLAAIAPLAAALVLPVTVVVFPAQPAVAAESGQYISFSPVSGGFTLAAGGAAAPLVVASGDFPGVLRVVNDFRSDVQRVTGVQPTVSNSVAAGTMPVMIGTIGRSPLIDGLISAGKLDVADVTGKWETSLQQVVTNPVAGVSQALVIAGSDQRGTIFGVYDVSKRIGVSPWHYFNDVPARQHSAVYVKPGSWTQGTPAVKYRGIFINDEDPATGTWANNTFPSAPSGHLYFEKVFEAMLRLKANYLWPLTWGRAFALDDPLNHTTATNYGIVMGTSHEAPMMRGITEWNRNPNAYGGTGQWSFVNNPTAVKAYWRDGIKRMEQQNIEGVVTLGMRGNGDEPSSDGLGIELMNDIIASQRQIIDEESTKPLTDIPQVFTLYKEVQSYWDQGLRPPDDVTVVFTDDNWGNIKRLPDQAAAPRAGGYGMYYHFDYVGGSRSYKWVDTINLANTWEQLNTVYRHGVQKLWVANVGDFKNEEAPVQFYLDYAWNPDAMPVGGIDAWAEEFAAQNFGDTAAPSIADITRQYEHLQARRKPEGLNRRYSRTGTSVTTDDTMTAFSLENYNELDRVTAEWQALAQQAETVRLSLPAADRDAYHHLVNYAVQATSNLYQLNKAQFRNRWYASQGRAATNDLATTAEARFNDDKNMSAYYNNTLAGGKWKGWQTQPKMGYGDKVTNGSNASWSSPPVDAIYPALQRITVPSAAEMGVAVDGSLSWWPNAGGTPTLPSFSPYQTQSTQYIDVFNRGTTSFSYQISSPVPWLTVTPSSGTVTKETRASVAVNWAQAPFGTTTVPITVTGAGRTITVQAPVTKPANLTSPLNGFVEANGYVSIEADHYSQAVAGDGVTWNRIPNIGRTGSGMQVTPTTAAFQTVATGPRLEYPINLTTTGPVTVSAYLSPRMAARVGSGNTYAVSIDDQAPVAVNIQTATGASEGNNQWGMNVLDAANRTETTFNVSTPGAHTLKFWAIDPTAVVQKFVVNTGGLKPSYLGPPESYRANGEVLNVPAISLGATSGAAGRSASVSTTVTNGTTSTMALAVSGLPTGATATFNPTSLAAGGTSTMTITNGSTTPYGTYVPTVTGTTTAGAVTASYLLWVKGTTGIVNGGFDNGRANWAVFGTGGPNATPAQAGATAARIGNTTASGDSSLIQMFTVPTGHNQLTFWYRMTCPDVVADDWFTATLANQTTGVTTTIQPKVCATNTAYQQVTAAVTAGQDYTLTLNGHDDGQAADPSLTLVDSVGTQSITPPLSLSAASGSANRSASAPVTVTNGTASTMTLAVSGLPTGATATFSPASVAPGGTSTLTVTNSSTTAFGTYALTVTGTAGATYTASYLWWVKGNTGIVNGGFDNGRANWAVLGTGSPNVTPAQAGPTAARIGSTTASGDSSLIQMFTVPSAKTTLSFWYRMTCPDTVDQDWFTATLTNQSTGVTSTIQPKVCATNTAYQQVTAGVTAGQSYTLTLNGRDDGQAGDPSFTNVDSVSIS